MVNRNRSASHASYLSLRDWHVLDLFGERFLDPNDPEIQQKYVPDGLHPNDEGHVLLAERIARFLEAL